MANKFSLELQRMKCKEEEEGECRGQQYPLSSETNALLKGDGYTLGIKAEPSSARGFPDR